jgi:hypothetical protein
VPSQTPVPDQLRIYLRNHEAAARGGYDLLRRAASSQRTRPHGDVLAALVAEDREDLEALHRLMRRLGVSPDPVLGTAARVGERLGRLKPNGHLLRRAPLSDLIEVEGALQVLQLKAAGWRALQAAGVVSDGQTDLPSLTARAEAQVARVTALHRDVAGTSLRAD